MDHKNVFLLAKESAPLNAIVGYKKEAEGYIVNILSFLIPVGTIVLVPKAHLRVAKELKEFEILSVSPGRRKGVTANSLKADDFVGGKKYIGAVNIAPLIHSSSDDRFVESRYDVFCRRLSDSFLLQENILYI